MFWEVGLKVPYCRKRYIAFSSQWVPSFIVQGPVVLQFRRRQVSIRAFVVGFLVRVVS